MPSDTWNSPDSLLFPGGSTQEFRDDPLQRLQRIQAKDPGSNSVLDYSYEYNTIGNIQKKITEYGTYTYPLLFPKNMLYPDVKAFGIRYDWITFIFFRDYSGPYHAQLWDWGDEKRIHRDMRRKH